MSSLQNRSRDNQSYCRDSHHTSPCPSPRNSPTDLQIHHLLFPGKMLANSQVAHRLGLIAAQSYRYSQTLLQADFSAAAASTAKSTYDVPEGHHNSDLSNTACNIGLGRRRDLTMRQDLRLWDGDKPLTLAQVFHVSCAVCGVCGSVQWRVCTNWGAARHETLHVTAEAASGNGTHAQDGPQYPPPRSLCRTARRCWWASRAARCALSSRCLATYRR